MTARTLARPNPTRCPWCWAGFPGHKPASECTCAAEEAAAALVGTVVAWEAPATNLQLGLASNAPTVRRIARVNHARPDGTVVAFDPDGIRCILDPANVEVIADHAEAGWAALR